MKLLDEKRLAVAGLRKALSKTSVSPESAANLLEESKARPSNTR